MESQTGCALESIVLGGGCFWCTDAVFTRVRGVLSVEAGYANGHVDHPSYEQVCTGQTGHVEGVKLVFDPQVVDLHALLEIFFGTHDPTTLNRQGHDVGTQYRSGIYFCTAQQEQVAQQLLRMCAQEQTFGAPVVTELQPLRSWWPAEEMHQNYFARNPYQGYCAHVVEPKVRKFLDTFARYAKPD